MKSAWVQKYASCSNPSTEQGSSIYCDRFCRQINSRGSRVFFLTFSGLLICIRGLLDNQHRWKSRWSCQHGGTEGFSVCAKCNHNVFRPLFLIVGKIYHTSASHVLFWISLSISHSLIQFCDGYPTFHECTWQPWISTPNFPLNTSLNCVADNGLSEVDCPPPLTNLWPSYAGAILRPSHKMLVHCCLCTTLDQYLWVTTAFWVSVQFLKRMWA